MVSRTLQCSLFKQAQKPQWYSSCVFFVRKSIDSIDRGDDEELRAAPRRVHCNGGVRIECGLLRPHYSDPVLVLGAGGQADASVGRLLRGCEGCRSGLRLRSRRRRRRRDYGDQCDSRCSASQAVREARPKRIHVWRCSGSNLICLAAFVHLFWLIKSRNLMKRELAMVFVSQCCWFFIVCCLFRAQSPFQCKASEILCTCFLVSG